MTLEFTLMGRRRYAKTEDREILDRVAAALEGNEQIEDVCAPTEAPPLDESVINLDLRFDWEMTPRELFRAIDGMVIDAVTGVI